MADFNISNTTNLGRSYEGLQDSMRRIASGQIINTDDPAGNAIADGFDSGVRQNFTQIANYQDEFNQLNVRDGALQGTNDMMQRLRELEVQSGNGTLTAEDRAMLQQEADQLLAGMEDITTGAQFNQQRVAMDMSPENLGIAGWQLGQEGGLDRLDQALSDVSSARSQIGARQSGLDQRINVYTDQAIAGTEAASRIRDVDFAREVSQMTQDQMRIQSGTTMQKVFQDFSMQQVSSLLGALG